VKKRVKLKKEGREELRKRKVTGVKWISWLEDSWSFPWDSLKL